MGSTQLMRKLSMGFARCRICPEYWAPESLSRWASSGSGIIPAL